VPFKSKAQQKYFFSAESRGDLPKGTAKQWAHHTPDISALPEHVKKASAGLFKKLPKIAPGRIMALLQKKAFVELSDLNANYGPSDQLSSYNPKSPLLSKEQSKELDRTSKRGRWWRKLNSMFTRGSRKIPVVGRSIPYVIRVPSGYVKAYSKNFQYPTPVPEIMTALEGTADAPKPMMQAGRALRRSLRRRMVKRGTLEFGFFDELGKTAGDDDLPTGFERLLIKGLKHIGKHADPVVVGKMHDIMRAVPQERKI